MSKPGRNEPCPCGSGKKYKHCHGAEARPAGTGSESPLHQLVQTALQYHRAGRLVEAGTLYQQILTRDPAHADATHLIGLMAHQSGKHAEAVEWIGRAIEFKGGAKAPMHNNLAQALLALQRNDEAIAHYRKAIELDANYADALNNLGVALTREGSLDEAEAVLKKAIKLNAKALNPRTNLGNLYQEMDRYADAIEAYRIALEIDPNHADTHNNLGNAFKQTGRLDQAVDCYQRATALNPAYARAWNNLAVALQLQGRMPEAFDKFRRALEIDQGDPNVVSNRALAYLACGNFADGWREYAARFARSADRPALRTLSQPAWIGEPLDGKKLRVWGEQGLGDEIWAAGLIPEVLERAKAGRLLIECRPKVVALFRRSFPRAEVIAQTDPPGHSATEGVDYQCACCSLGTYLRPDIASFSKREDTGGAYLFADASRETYWRQRIAGLGPGLKVGISWRSGDVTGARALYYTHLAQWGVVLKLPGVHFINLQYDECENELSQAESAFGAKISRFYEVDMFDDLDETAALMRGLDLVISAPTTVSILAAALGVRVWQMHYCTDWQWHGLPHSPWYPNMKNYPRRWDQTWEEVLGNIGSDLASMGVCTTEDAAGKSRATA